MIAKEKVRQQMRKQKIKRFTDLAEELGVSKQTISNWFNGGPFSSPNLDQLIKVLACTPNDVLVWGVEEEKVRTALRLKATSVAKT